MGMFSYNCKGCGHELVTHEDVRLNGMRQLYDGYGGSASNAECYDPVAWHQRCYEHATDKQKLDETPSKHARNQGFGPSKLEFRRDYNPAAETKYYPVVTGYFSNEDMTNNQRYTFYLTNSGKLEDFEAHNKKWQSMLDTKYQAIEKAVAGGMPEEEYDAFSEQLDKGIEAEIGKSPDQDIKMFDSMEAAIVAADALLGELPSCLGGVYELTVYGRQSVPNLDGAFKPPVKILDGAVYERNVRQRWDRTGGYSNWKKLEGLETEVVYQIGVKAAGHAL